MGKIFCLMGKSGSGKSTLEKELAGYMGLKKIVSTTTRPIRENEVDGVDYHYITEKEFSTKLTNGDFLENTIYNNWKYSIDKAQIDLDKNNYICVIEPHGYNQLKANLGEDKLVPIYIYVNDKERALRVLNREENPDVEEICRRFLSDIELFEDIEKDNSIFKIENDSFHNVLTSLRGYIFIVLKPN